MKTIVLPARDAKAFSEADAEGFEFIFRKPARQTANHRGVVIDGVVSERRIKKVLKVRGSVADFNIFYRP